MGLKPDDSHALPGCTHCHHLEHTGMASLSGYEDGDVALMCIDHVAKYVAEQGKSRELLDHITEFLKQHKL
jgi:hypothetical protein